MFCLGLPPLWGQKCSISRFTLLPRVLAITYLVSFATPACVEVLYQFKKMKKRNVLCNVWRAGARFCLLTVLRNTMFHRLFSDTHHALPLWFLELLPNKLHSCKSSPFCSSHLIQPRITAVWFAFVRGTTACAADKGLLRGTTPLQRVKVELQAFCSLNGLFLFFSVFCVSAIWRQQLFCSPQWLRSNFGSIPPHRWQSDESEFLSAQRLK